MKVNGGEKYFSEIFKNQDGDYFICNEFESKKASLPDLCLQAISDTVFLTLKSW